MTTVVQVKVWDCSVQSNQQRTLRSDGTIVDVQFGFCLDVTGSATANGTVLEL